MIPLKQYNTKSGISIEILKQRYSKLAPEMYITKEENDARHADSRSNTYRDLCSCFDKLGIPEFI